MHHPVCEQATETLSALADRERPCLTRRALRHHLDRCATCRSFQDTLQADGALAAATRRLQVQPIQPPPHRLLALVATAAPPRTDSHPRSCRRHPYRDWATTTHWTAVIPLLLAALLGLGVTFAPAPTAPPHPAPCIRNLHTLH